MGDDPGPYLRNSVPFCLNTSGSKSHKADNVTCPARGEQCAKCLKIGHFASVCKNLKSKFLQKVEVSNVEEFDEEMCNNLVLTVEGSTGRIKGPLGYVKIGSVDLKIMGDSGSLITIISDKTFEELWEGKALLPSDVNPKAFGEFDIVMHGYFEDSLNFKGRSINKDLCRRKWKEYSWLEGLGKTWYVKTRCRRTNNFG